MKEGSSVSRYRGRLAPSPTGYLHLGHARTFWLSQERARGNQGTLILRNEDLDPTRSRPEFVTAMIEDLRWLGLEWQEGPDVGGQFAPYMQSERKEFYRVALQKLQSGGFVYPCYCSRQDVLRALQAPHLGEDEPVYPGTCRPELKAEAVGQKVESGAGKSEVTARSEGAKLDLRVNWRFRVTDGEVLSFVDGQYGPQSFVAGKDFGDFIVWRHDDTAAYQLAVVVDDAAMQITEVVRGEDLLKSTARQLLLYRALELRTPDFYHCPLLKNEAGIRLAKRDDAFSLRALRSQGFKPEELRAGWGPA
jgi:glutamyl-tRNA synthetase